MYNGSIGIGSTSHSMNNNNTGRRKKKSKEKKVFSVDKVPKEQKNKADVIDVSASIIDIDDTPDVAAWNKKIHIKGDAAGIIGNRSHEEDIRPLATIGIGLRGKKRSKKDLIIDPANKKEVAEGMKSGSTFTDEADDLS